MSNVIRCFLKIQVCCFHYISFIPMHIVTINALHQVRQDCHLQKSCWLFSSRFSLSRYLVILIIDLAPYKMLK